MLAHLVRAGGAARRAALSLESSLAPRLDAASAAAAARRTLRGEAEEKYQRRAALSPFRTRLGATPAAARRTLYTEPEKLPKGLTPDQLWLLREMYRVEAAWAKELDDLRQQNLLLRKRWDEAVAAHNRVIPEADAAAREELLDDAVCAYVMFAMALIIFL